MSNATRQLRYDDTNVVRHELPADLALTTTSAIYLTVYDDDGTALVARAQATTYTSTTIGSAVTVGDSSFVLAAGAGALEPGDRVRILDSDMGPDEDVLVHHYDSSTRTVHAVESLRCSHSVSAGVVGMWATASIDMTDTDVYEPGSTVILAWEHGSDESSARKYTSDLYTVGSLGLGGSDVLDRFATRFPDLALKIQDRRNQALLEARRELTWECSARGCDLDKIVDQEVIMIPLLLKLALIAAGVSDQYAAEREQLLAEYAVQFDRAMSLPIWVNLGDDLAKSDDETRSHVRLSWGRGL